MTRSEYKKCLLDTSREYMIDKYALGQGKDLWCIQKNVLDLMNSLNTVVVTKSRNVGFTSLMAMYTACELYLNSDEKAGIIYVGQSYQMACHFRKMVAMYLDAIRENLGTWSGENLEVSISESGGLKVGDARLMCYSVRSYLERFYCVVPRQNVKSVIIDEPVAGDTDNDVNLLMDYTRKTVFKDMDVKIVIGSTPNRFNSSWYKLVEKYHYTPHYIRMEWWDNECKVKEDPIVEITDADFTKFYRTNKRHTELRKMLSEDNFEDEIEARVCKIKTVYEYL